MKISILVTLFSSILQGINAQEIEIKSNTFLGGSINFVTQNNTYPLSSLSIISAIGGIYSNSTDDTKYTTFAVTPYIGREINQQLFVGLLMDYRLAKYKADGAFVIGQSFPVDLERTSNQLGFGLFTRHILNPNNQIRFFIQPYCEYNLLNEKEARDSKITQEEKANYFELGAGIGVLYNINNYIRFTLRTGGLNYVNGKWEIKDTDTAKNFSSFGTNFNLNSIFLGIEIRI